MDKEYVENLLAETKRTRVYTRVAIAGTCFIVLLFIILFIVKPPWSIKAAPVKKYIDISNPQILIVRGHEYIPVQSESKTPDSCVCYTLVHAADCKNSNHKK